MNIEIKRTLIRLIDENKVSRQGDQTFYQYDFTAINAKTQEKTNIIIQGNNQYCEVLINYKTFTTTRNSADQKDIWDLFEEICKKYNAQNNTQTREEYEQMILMQLQGLVKHNKR